MEWISQRLSYCLNGRYIADTWKSTFRAAILDITSFFSPSKFQLCWISGFVIMKFFSSASARSEGGFGRP
jgi:hypothetical protein